MGHFYGSYLPPSLPLCLSSSSSSHHHHHHHHRVTNHKPAERNKNKNKTLDPRVTCRLPQPSTSALPLSSPRPAGSSAGFIYMTVRCSLQRRRTGAARGDDRFTHSFTHSFTHLFLYSFVHPSALLSSLTFHHHHH